MLWSSSGLDIVVGGVLAVVVFICCFLATHSWVGGQEEERKQAEDAEAERKRAASKVCVR